MKALLSPGILLLTLAYVLSQFFRSFLAVLSQPLNADLGITSDGLAFASGLWFLSFAAMQIPVGWALDTIGARRVAAILLLVGGAGGALVFALAQSAWHINLSMILVGIGCAPVLMASYYIFARQYPPAQFATLAAAVIGIGTLGNIGASYPTALAAELIGWRATMWVLAVVSALVAFGIWFTVTDPPKVVSEKKGSFLELLRMPVVWLFMPLMVVNYAPVGAIRGVWIGPYFGEVFESSTVQIGTATLIMSFSMAIGAFAYGPLDRIFGTRKWIIAGGLGLTALCTLLLAVFATVAPATSMALCAAIGFFGAAFPVVIAHARSFFPPHLTGRGVTLMNLFGVGGVGIMQFVTGRVFGVLDEGGAVQAYQGIFALLGIALLVGLIPYLWTRDNLN
ncbi:MAG: MFS transporter [Paracoccaceae bacterium]